MSSLNLPTINSIAENVIVLHSSYHSTHRDRLQTKTFTVPRNFTNTGCICYEGQRFNPLHEIPKIVRGQCATPVDLRAKYFAVLYVLSFHANSVLCVVHARKQSDHTIPIVSPLSILTILTISPAPKIFSCPSQKLTHKFPLTEAIWQKIQ